MTTRQRLAKARERERHWTQLAELAFTLGAFADAQKYARLADVAAERREKLEQQLFAEMQRYQRELQRTLYPPTRIPLEYELEEEQEFDDDESYIEWEFAFEYEASKGPSSNIDVNFRVWRNDARPFTAKEAKIVMDYVRKHRGDTPRGYKVTGIDWRNPPKPFKSNRDKGVSVEQVQDDIVSILDSVADSPGLWRLGAVKY